MYVRHQWAVPSQNIYGIYYHYPHFTTENTDESQRSEVAQGWKDYFLQFFKGNNCHFFQILISKNTGHLETMSFQKLTEFVKIRICYFCLSQQLT